MSEVYKSIAAVQGELAKTGIAKNRKNSQGSGYMFRGIDDVYAAIAPLLATHELCIIPRLIERTQIDRVSQKGGALFYVTVKAEFDFVSAKDGSKHTACTFGEAMDSGDKATNKAMSAAYKYAAFMTFAIPTEGDNDADATTHEVEARSEPVEPQHITDDQRDELSALIDGRGLNVVTVCQAMGIKSLKQIWQHKFEEAKAFVANIQPEKKAE